MIHKLIQVIAIFFIAVHALTACAGGQNGIENLESFIKSAKTGRSDFVQTVTLPAKDGRPERTKTSSGSFEFVRPSHFRFVYKKPFEQTIVADGQTLWLYDVDLNQVTARKQSQVLASTPAALIASAADIQSLQSDFILTPQPDSDGLTWVQATPKNRDNPLQYIRVGFRQGEHAAHAVLVALDMMDNFGQRSHLRFSGIETGIKLDAKAFQFKPPPNADVIRQ